MSDEFSFQAYNVCSGAKIAEIPFTSFTWTEVLNAPGSIDATLPWFSDFASLANLEPRSTAIYVDQSGQIRYGGMIDRVELDRSRGDGLRVTGSGFWAYYRDRWIRSTAGMTWEDTASVGPTDVAFTAVDQFRIVKDLVDHAATIAGSANVGFTSVRANGAAFTTSGQTRTKKWSTTERKAIASAVEELASQQYGFDFSVGFDWDSGTSPWTPRRYLDLWYPRRGLDGGLVLDDGGSVALLRLVRDGKNLANPLVGVGPGTGDAALIYEANDGSYRYPAGPYPYTEGSWSYRTDGQEYAGNLGRLTEGRLFRTKQPINTATARLLQRRDDAGPIFGLGDFSVGDTVRVISPGTIDLDERMRVVSQKVTVGDVGITDWTVNLANEDASTMGI